MDDMWPCDAVVGNTAASCLCAGLCTEKPDRSCSAAQQAIQLLRAAGLSRGTKNKHYGLSTITDYHYHFSSARLVCKGSMQHDHSQFRLAGRGQSATLDGNPLIRMTYYQYQCISISISTE